MKRKQINTNHQTGSQLNEISFLSKSSKYFLLLIVALGVFFLILTLKDSFDQNKAFGFPLDDPWIHLQFAKNLNEYGTFSYYKNELVTAGSTAPLYTGMLAIGFFITKNEFLLSYFFGITFLVGSAIILYMFLQYNFNSKLFALTGALLILFEPRLQWASLSGMETTLAVFLLLTTAYAYRKKFSVLLGAAAGLSLWVRPETLIFVGCIFIDMLYHRYIVTSEVTKKQTREAANYKWLLGSTVIFGLLAVMYFGFNLYLSGSLFPNTFSAKIKYYSSGNTDYWTQLFKFLSIGHLLIISIFFAIGGLSIIKNVLFRKPEKNLLYLFWMIGMAVAFSIFLPHLYQNGRYLMPVLPFYLIVAFEGLAISVKFVAKIIFKTLKTSILQTLLVIIFFVFVIQFFLASVNGVKDYSETCKYINDRQVVTARWLNANLTKDAIVATHDIGAIGFYSGRKIVDMVGLVSPDMIPRIGSFDALEKFLNEKKVTHLAVLRNWFHLGNQPIIYETNEMYPEVMEVFEYHPESVMFVPQNIIRVNEEAEYFLSIGNIQQAGKLLNQSAQSFPRLAWTYFLIGQAYVTINKPTKAEEFFKNALILDSTYKNARDAISQLKR